MSTAKVRSVLNTPFWIESLIAREPYSRLHDDHDGEFTGRLSVMFDQMGDAYVTTDSGRNYLRFRTVGGGGHSERTRTALMILAEAIRLDNESKPQP